MFRTACIAVATLLLASADVPRIFRLKPAPATNPQVEFPADESLPVLPELGQTPTKPEGAPAKKAGPLQPESRLEIIRFVAGEFAKVLKALPTGKKGFHLKAGSALDEKALREAVMRAGSAANPGDTVQITRLEFRDRQIVFDINGGGTQRKSWRDRIQVSMGGVPTVSVSNPNATPGYQRVGATVYLDFDRPLPEMTSDQVKQYLSGLLDFSKQRSAAVQWVETLPPEFQKAIKDKRATVGMDREMVMAAIGKPDRKVRERDPEGNETETWIYGRPPAKTTFVKFLADKVVKVDEFP